jgi:hypothetical protein
MFYGDYSYELARERMETANRDHERIPRSIRRALTIPRSARPSCHPAPRLCR